MIRRVKEAVEDFVDDWFGWLLVAFVVVAIALFVAVNVHNAKQPHIALLKSEWACTNTQVVPVTTYVKSGDAMVPIVTMMRTCVQWSKQP